MTRIALVGVARILRYLQPTSALSRILLAATEELRAAEPSIKQTAIRFKHPFTAVEKLVLRRKPADDFLRMVVAVHDLDAGKHRRVLRNVVALLRRVRDQYHGREGLAPGGLGPMRYIVEEDFRTKAADAFPSTKVYGEMVVLDGIVPIFIEVQVVDAEVWLLRKCYDFDHLDYARHRLVKAVRRLREHLSADADGPAAATAKTVDFVTTIRTTYERYRRGVADAAGVSLPPAPEDVLAVQDILRDADRADRAAERRAGRTPPAAAEEDAPPATRRRSATL